MLAVKNQQEAACYAATNRARNCARASLGVCNTNPACYKQSSGAHLYNNHTIDESVAEPAGCGAFLLPNGHEPLEVRLCLVSFASFALPLPLLLLLLSAAAAAEKPFEKSFETLTLTPASTTRW